jgi:AraC family transcriptional regulator
MNHTSTSTSQLLSLLPAPPAVSAEWNTFSLHVIDEAPAHVRAAYDDHLLGLILSGRGHRVRHDMDGHVVEGRNEPGAVHLVPAGIQTTFETSAPFRTVALFVPDVFLSRVLAEYWNANRRDVEIAWQFLARDRVLASVMTRLATEAQNGSPSGQLYAESACEFLAHHVIHAYSSLSTPSPGLSGGLAGRRLKTVLDYIAENLGRAITLRGLAALAGVSARHFERAFRQAVGVPAYAYVLEKRVSAARHLLLSKPELPVGEIAARLGFSSSSHLASAFRRQTGCSPTTFRRLNFRRSHIDLSLID